MLHCLDECTITPLYIIWHFKWSIGNCLLNPETHLLRQCPLKGVFKLLGLWEIVE